MFDYVEDEYNDGYEDGYDGDVCEETNYPYEDFDSEVKFEKTIRLIASREDPSSLYCPDDGRFYLPIVFSSFDLIHGGKTIQIEIDFETYDKLTINPSIW